MTVGSLADHELVVHAYAPVDGPQALSAAAQLRTMWEQGRLLLGLTEPIPRLPTELPTDLRADGAGPGKAPVLAAQQDLAADFRMIARRRHDVVNVSILFAAPSAEDPRPDGHLLARRWTRFSRCWQEVCLGGTDALLGVVRVYQAVTQQAVNPTGPELSVLTAEVRATLPTLSADPQWWDRGRVTSHGFLEFDVVSRGARYDRAVVVVAGADDAATLRAYTWGRGDPGLPPLARYLLHTAKVRYQARLRGTGANLSWLRRQTLDRADETATASWGDDDCVDADQVRTDPPAEQLELTRNELVDMRRAVAIALDDMGASGVEPFGEDERLARGLRDQLNRDRASLAAAEDRRRGIDANADRRSRQRRENQRDL